MKTTAKDEKLIIYQLFPRILTNDCMNPRPWGTLEQNGSGKLNDLTPRVIRSIRELGVNVLWLTGVIEHASKTVFPGIPAQNPNVVKGVAGSPYAICDYYDVDPALATDIDRRMEEFEALVDRVHAEKLKVIIDFVPNHTARQYRSDAAPSGISDFGSADDSTKFFSPSNNYYYIPNQRFSPGFPLDAEGGTPYSEFPAKATGDDCFTAFCTQNNWYETVKLNYGHDYGDGSDHFDPVPDTWLKMLHILRFWASKGIDGFRCDMVFMVPLPFWHWAIPQVKADYPGLIFIGEIYDISLYRPFLDYGCFDYLYDKVNLYDTLVGIERHGVSAAMLTSCWQTVDGIGDRMLNFLENHDEVRLGSKSFAGDPVRGVPHMTVAATISRGPVMIYYGQELGESAADNEGFAGDNDRTTIFDYWSYPTMRRWYNGGAADGGLLTVRERWLRDFYRRLLTLCNKSAAIREGGFFDLMYVNLRQEGFDPHNSFVYLRHSGDEALLVAVNFSRKETLMTVNVPDAAFDAACLAEAQVTVRDLLWDIPVTFGLRRGEPLCLTVPPSCALIIPLPVLELNGKGETEPADSADEPEK